MQTLGLSESTPRTENRLKSLLWPSISTGNDVDYLGTQGYWVCAVVAVGSFVFALASDQPITAVVALLFYYLGGVGVRERSRYAAIIVFAVFFLDLMLLGFSVVRILFTALLLSNVRATWIAYHWQPGSEEAGLPARLNETWSDKFADVLPAWLWPKVRYVYYVFSACFLGLAIIGIAMARGIVGGSR
jgi:hypothetical protein